MPFEGVTLPSVRLSSQGPDQQKQGDDFMYVRMSRYSGKPGTTTSAITERAETLRGDMGKTGATAIHSVQTGDNSYCTIAIYKSKADADAAAEIAKAIWGNMADLIDMSTMHLDAGDVVFAYRHG